MRIAIMALAFAVCGGLLHAAYLESGYGPSGPPPRIVPPPPRVIPPPPPPAVDNPLARTVRRLTVQEGREWRGLTVFRLEVAKIEDHTSYLSSQEALTSGDLDVWEAGGGTVAALMVRNRGPEPVLLLGGELLLGGKQNRVLRDDILLPAHSGRVKVPVLCIEQGRWSAHPRGFEGRESLAPQRLRGGAVAGRDQEEIWAGVRDYQRRLRVGSRTEDLDAVHEDRAVQEALRDYREHFAGELRRPRTVGMVVGRGGRIVGADVFCNPAVFRKYRDRLLDSHAVDCVGRAPWDGKPPSRREAGRFLRRVFRAQIEWRPTPGLGELLAVGGADLRGVALIRREAVVHACLFPEAETIVRPLPPSPAPRPVPGPRDGG